MMSDKQELTPEQEAQIKPWADKWIAHAFRTEPLTNDEKESVKTAIDGLYKKAGLAKPLVTAFARSPYSGAICYGICEGAWECDDDTSDAVKYVSAMAVATERVRLALGRINEAKVDAAPLDSPLATKIIKEVMDLAVEVLWGGVKPKVPRGTEADPAIARMMTDGVLASHEAANPGNQASAWVAHVTFYRYVVKLEADFTQWDDYEKAATGGPRFMHEKFCIVSDMPNAVHVDRASRAHCQDGPSHSWPDGWAIYSWRGTRVPPSWIKDKDSLDPMAALNWKNVEQRRCAAEILGWDRIISALNAKTIDAHPNPEIGTLLEVDIPGSGKSRFLRVRCGTGRTFALPVRREAKTALEANASTYNLKPQDLLEMEFRT